MFKLEIETDGAAFCNPDTGSKDDLFGKELKSIDSLKSSNRD